METEDKSGDAPAKQSIPWVVHAGAALVPALAIVVALVVGVIASVVAGTLEPLSLGTMVGAMMLGQGLDVFAAAGFPLGMRFRATLGFVPFGVIVPAAFVLHRVGFTSAWLRVRSARLLPAVAGGLASFVVAILLTRPSEPTFRGDLIAFVVEASFRPGWALLVGAAPWLLAVLLANHAPSATILRGLLILQGIVVAGIMLLSGYVFFEEGAPFSVVIAVTLIAGILGLAVSTNLIAMLLVMPLGGAVGARFGEFSESFSLLEFLRNDSSNLYLWALIAVSVGGTALLGWRAGPHPDLRSAVRSVGDTFIGATAVVLPMLLFGRFYGDLSSELGLAGFRLPGGSAAFAASFGSSGQPVRWVLILAVMGLILLVTHVLAAQQAGLSWASSENLSTQGQTIARTASGTLRDAAERARLAAEAAANAAGSTSAPAGDGQARPAADDAAQHDPRPAPPEESERPEHGQT